MDDEILRKEFGFFTVEAIKKEYHVDYKIYEGIGHLDELDKVPDYDGEEPIMVGYIKWDGCSNWKFQEVSYPLHFCSYAEVKDFANLFPKLQEWTAELMAGNDFILG